MSVLSTCWACFFGQGQGSEKNVFFPGVLLMFLQQFALHPKLFFLPILGSLPSSGEAEEEVIRPKPSRKFLAALTLILKQKLKSWKYVDQSTDLAQLKWSRVGEVQKGASPAKSGCLASSDLFGSTSWRKGWKTMTTFPNICSLLDYNWVNGQSWHLFQQSGIDAERIVKLFGHIGQSNAHFGLSAHHPSDKDVPQYSSNKQEQEQ